MKSAVASPTMIGRGRELRQLHDVLAETLQGVPRAVVVAGEAGIGKTRLLAEFQVDAGDSARILVGQCVDLGSAGVPYAPIIAVLRSLVQQAGPDAVLAAAGVGREALALLLPELASRPADRAAAGVER
ncbi:MAG TPA: ATP-binding protein, partial [Homoserinimonas sp.]|nr:ATP-binding protein [Homoserinimonas sp.]